MWVEEYVNTAPEIWGGMRGRAVLETLSVLMAAELRERVLREALRLEGVDRIPEDPFRIRAFVEGPLRLVIRRDVGPRMASFVVEDLQPVLERLERAAANAPPCFDPHDLPTRRPSSGVRTQDRMETARPRARGHSSGAVPSSSQRGAVPMVVVATAEPRAAQTLEPLLFEGVEVYRVTREHELLTAVQTFQRPLWVIVDQHRRVIELATLAVFLPRVPDGCALMVWGPLAAEDEPFANREGWDRIDAPADWASVSAALRARMLRR